jgi:hypothetical protein
MSVADNFDYSIPSIPKGNTMYLSTINKNDAIIRPFKKMVTKRDWSANLYNLDIESSMPRRFGVFTNKIDYINKVDDIERTNPKILHYPLNKPEFNLTNKDIEKSSPQMKHLKTNRCTNPLEPKYTLPKVEEYPPSVPKFIRDSIDIKDISGARPQKYFQWKTRETFPINNHGIEGSKTKETYVRKRLGNNKYDYIDYSDLTIDIFKTRRNTNPLDPIYGFKKNQDIFKYGPIEKSKPMTQYPYFYQPSLNLKLNDIKGTNIGSKNRINKFTGNNYELTTQDIPGCCVGSLKKGIVTKRCTNPLNPNYQFLGEKELAGEKFGEYSKKNRAKSVSTMNSTNNTMKEETKNVENANPKMVKINDIDKEPPKSDKNININNNNENINNINNAEIKSNSHFEEDKSESNYNRDIYNNNDTINFDREKFGKKPDPNYAFLHDPSVHSSENIERLKLIEKEKGIRIAQKTLLMSKTGNGFFNTKNLNGGNEIAKYQNNPNLTNFVQYQRLNSKNNRMNYGGKIANNLGGVGHLNLENGTSEIENEPNDMKRMNKTTIGFLPMKKTYEEKLDNFMAKNNLKYIEPNKIEKKPPTPNKKEIKSETGNSYKGSKVSNNSNKINQK